MARFGTTAFLLAALMLSACDDGGPYRMGTSAQELGYRDLGQALQTELGRRGSLTLELVETDGSVDNAARLLDGDLDFALVQGGFIFDVTGLTLLAHVDTEYLHVVVPNDSGVRDLADLAGKRVAAGIAGTGSRKIAESLVRAAQFDPPAEFVAMTRSAALAGLAAGEVDVAVFVTGLRRELGPLLTDGRFRLVGVETAEALALLLYDMEVAAIPAGVYGANLALPPVPVTSLATSTNLLARHDVPDGAVRRVMQALFSHRVQRDARLPRLSEETARPGSEAYLHPAAEAYYRRNDPVTADQFEIAAFWLAAAIAILGLIRYVWQRYRRWRVPSA